MLVLPLWERRRVFLSEHLSIALDKWGDFHGTYMVKRFLSWTVEHVTAERTSLIPGSLERITARVSQFPVRVAKEMFNSDNDTDWSDTSPLLKRHQAK